jgi:hypothetical protein
VVPGRLEWIGQTLVETSTIMVDQRGLAMHRMIMLNDFHSMDVGDGLMTKTDTQNGDATGEVPDEITTDTCLFGRAGPWRDDEMSRVHRLRLFETYLIVSSDFHDEIGIDDTHSMDQIPCEGVIVVDQ